MIEKIKSNLHRQFGAAAESLKKAIEVCPEEFWCQNKDWDFWYVTYHTIFWIDYYLAKDRDSYTPPEPFTLSELDPAGIIPESPYSKEQLLNFLELGHEHAHQAINEMDNNDHIYKFGSTEGDLHELILYIMRHIQHHVAQLNLLLRQSGATPPRWVSKG